MITPEKATPQHSRLWVHGSGLKPGGMPTEQTRLRALVARVLHEEDPFDMVVFSGNKSHWDNEDHGVTEAAVMQEIAGIPDALLDEASTSVITNYQHGLQLLGEMSRQTKLVIVTGRLVVKRISLVNNHVLPEGLEPRIIPVSEDISPKMMLKEAVRLASTWLASTGTTNIDLIAQREADFKTPFSPEPWGPFSATAHER